MTLDDHKQLLNSYFISNGILLCNESTELPYLEGVGGSWNGIVSLIEEGSVFYSKLYRGRVSYLSRAFYANVKPYKQRIEKLSPIALQIYNFLKDGKIVSSEDIKALLHLSGKTFSKSMDELFGELLVTAIKQDRFISENWCSFCWGTCETWEALHPVCDIAVSMDSLRSLTEKLITERQLRRILM